MEQKLEAIEHGEGENPVSPPTEPPREDNKALIEEVTSKYGEVLKQHQAINGSLKAFKGSLEMPEDSDIPACFNTIKKAAGLTAKIEVVHTDPLELRVDETSWKDFPEKFKDAVSHFNAVLRSCYELLREKEQTVDYIESRLSKIESGSAEEADVKDIPVRISEFVEEVESLLGEINAATYFFGNDSLGFMPAAP